MTFDDLLQIELPSLRQEMLEVKKCQHQVFIFEIMSTGAIIAFILSFLFTILDKIHFWPVLFFLSPMIIIIPSQYIILDKAITINRICSYFKVIESYVASNTLSNNKNFYWETGCAEFRKRSYDLEPAGSAATQKPNQFYMLIFIIMVIITLMLLSLMAIFYSLSIDNNGVRSTEIFIMLCLTISIIIIMVHQFIWLCGTCQ